MVFSITKRKANCFWCFGFMFELSQVESLGISQSVTSIHAPETLLEKSLFRTGQRPIIEPLVLG